MLNSFATEAGVVLSFDNGLTEGKQSRGINGRYSIDQGFAVLLSGSGLQAVAGGDNSYVLLPAAPSGSLQLDATNVTARGWAPSPRIRGRTPQVTPPQRRG